MDDNLIFFFFYAVYYRGDGYHRHGREKVQSSPYKEQRRVCSDHEEFEFALSSTNWYDQSLKRITRFELLFVMYL